MTDILRILVNKFHKFISRFQCICEPLIESILQRQAHPPSAPYLLCQSHCVSSSLIIGWLVIQAWQMQINNNHKTNEQRPFFTELTRSYIHQPPQISYVVVLDLTRTSRIFILCLVLTNWGILYDKIKICQFF